MNRTVPVTLLTMLAALTTTAIVGYMYVMNQLEDIARVVLDEKND